MSTIAFKKQCLRLRLQKHFAMVDEKKKRSWSTKISTHIVKMDMYKKANIIAFFIPLDNEPDIWSVIRNAWEHKKTVAIPRIEGKKLTLRKITEENDLETGPFNVRQPKPDQPIVSSTSIQVIFVPALAFDQKGYRLGHGIGYYDRLLKTIDVQKIGVCYGFQLIDELPHGRHDIKVDGIITESYNSIPGFNTT